MLSNLFAFRREAVYRQRFFENAKENLFMGSFTSFEEALAEAPSTMPLGYDHAAAVDLYKPQIYPYDYPALFWITRSIDQGMRNIFDLGGHIGLKYHAFKRVLDWPEELRWKVCDVPSIAAAGRELAVQRKVDDQLSFCTDFREAAAAEVLYASGSLQYLPMQIGEILGSLSAKPKRIVLNAAAVHPRRTIFTLNSIGVAICPYRIQHDDDLNHQTSEAGYRRVDSWRNEGKPIEVPFVEGGDEAYYMGSCWDLR